MTLHTADPNALARLEAAVQRRPADVGALGALADAYMAADAFDLATPLLEHAVRLAPRDARLRWQLVECLRQVERGRGALAHVREALRLDPGDPADAAFQLAIALDDAGDGPAAAECYRRSLALDPDQPGAWIRLGFLLLGEGQPAEAVPVFDRATELRPGSARPWAGLAIAASKAGRHEKVVLAARRSLELDARQVRIWHTLGSALRALGRFDEAAMAFAEAVLLRPDNPYALLSLGFVEIKRQNFTEAVGHLRRAVCRLPSDVRPWAALAHTLGMLGEDRAAFEAARQVARLAPGLARAHLMLARLGLAARRHAEAERALLRLLALDPCHLDALDLLADILMSSGRHSEAEPVLAFTVEIAPGHASAWLHLEACRRGTSLCGDDAELRPTLGRTYQDADKPVAAIDAFTRLNQRATGDASATSTGG
jgi:tetratricopeptide (TPR) repeat protein